MKALLLPPRTPGTSRTALEHPSPATVHPRRVDVSPARADWFWSRVSGQDKPHGHWRWQGAHRDPAQGGHGLLRLMPGASGPGSMIYAHRLAYILDHGGIVLPVGALVCHRCDVPLCCNPAHLYLCTELQNMADAVRRGRASTLWKHGAVPPRVRAYMASKEYWEHLEHEALIAPTFYQAHRAQLEYENLGPSRAAAAHAKAPTRPFRKGDRVALRYAQGPGGSVLRIPSAQGLVVIAWDNGHIGVVPTEDALQELVRLSPENTQPRRATRATKATRATTPPRGHRAGCPCPVCAHRR